MAEVNVEIRYNPTVSPIIVCQSIYHEADDMVLHDFQNRTIECIIDEREMYKLKKISGVLDVDIVG